MNIEVCKIWPYKNGIIGLWNKNKIQKIITSRVSHFKPNAMYLIQKSLYFIYL
jgi:hypothetical protein